MLLLLLLRVDEKEEKRVGNVEVARFSECTLLFCQRTSVGCRTTDGFCLCQVWQNDYSGRDLCAVHKPRPTRGDLARRTLVHVVSLAISANSNSQSVG